MGTDISLHKEVKINGKWHYWGEAQMNRNYSLFNYLAGVRSSEFDIAPIDGPRGVPEDITFETKFNLDYDEGVCYSWINREEVGLVEKYFDNFGGAGCIEDQWGYLLGGGWSDGCDIEGVEDVRFVFWFD